MNIELTLNIDQISTMIMNTEHLFRYWQLTVIISNYYLLIESLISCMLSTTKNELDT